MLPSSAPAPMGGAAAPYFTGQTKSVLPQVVSGAGLQNDGGR